MGSPSPPGYRSLLFLFTEFGAGARGPNVGLAWPGGLRGVVSIKVFAVVLVVAGTGSKWSGLGPPVLGILGYETGDLPSNGVTGDCVTGERLTWGSFSITSSSS